MWIKFDVALIDLLGADIIKPFLALICIKIGKILHI